MLLSPLCYEKREASTLARAPSMASAMVGAEFPPRTRTQGSLWELNQNSMRVRRTGRRNQTCLAISQAPLGSAQNSRRQIFLGLRQKPKGSCVHTASIQKADHRKQIPRNRKQISSSRKQKGARIQGQIPERRWQNPAVLEFC